MAATIFETGLSAKETEKANPEAFATIIQGRMIREPLRFVYIHSTAKRSFGPIHHRLFPRLKLKGCGPTERVTMCAKIADPVTQWSPDIERGGQRPDEFDALTAANDVLNPAGMTENNSSDNCNLVARGLFVSLNEKPTEDEIRNAEAARDKRYLELVTKARRLESTNKQWLDDFLTEEPDVHAAMDALGQTATWHTTPLVMAICPNCGDSIKTGIAFHQSSAGVLCVVDPERAFKAGAITRERYEDLITAPEPVAAPKKRA